MCGKTYMLTQDEELWEKQLPAEVENLLAPAREESAPSGAGQFMSLQSMASPAMAPRSNRIQRVMGKCEKKSPIRH